MRTLTRWTRLSTKALSNMALLILVSNEYIYIPGPVEQFSLSDWHQTGQIPIFWGYVTQFSVTFLFPLERELEPSLIWVGGKVPLCLTPQFPTLPASLQLPDWRKRCTQIKPKAFTFVGIYPSVLIKEVVDGAKQSSKRNDQDTQTRRRISSTEKVPQRRRYSCGGSLRMAARAIWDAVKISGLRC